MNSKPSYEEVRNLLEGKVSQTEINSELTSLNSKVDEMQKDFHKKSANYATNKEITQIVQTLEGKANLIEINETLNTKASKESVINALHRKANKNEVDAVLKSKVDIEELQNVVNTLNNKSDVNDIDKIFNILDNKVDKNDFTNMSNLITTKSDVKDFDLLNTCYQEIKRDCGKRIEELDQDIDRLIENIKKEFGNMNIVVNNLDMKKVDFKEFEKLSANVSKKTDNEILNNSLTQIKNDIYDSFTHYRNEIEHNKKMFEDGISEKVGFMERNMEKNIDEFNKNKEKMNDIFDRRKIDQEENIKMSKSMVNGLHKEMLVDINMLRGEIQKILNDINDLHNRKTEKKEFESVKNKLFEYMDNKVKIF